MTLIFFTRRELKALVFLPVQGPSETVRPDSDLGIK